ncbi:MAG: hypothetical protein EOR69_31920 [Mesorhizobium sp.]|nr:MAG: hypothetical protein EOR69_31920 [Mesorhizobium sp.]RWL92285.1 MAG: hypothetical protein EOR70_32085 [Mesorhizobium sp.]
MAQLLSKARTAAAGNFGVLSTGEKLAVALILNRPDWLAEMNYTLAEAIERVGPDWLRLIPAAARQFEQDRLDVASAEAEEARQAKLAMVRNGRAADDVIDFAATLVTYGEAPGYRDAHFVFDLQPIGGPAIRARIRVRPEDGEQIVRHVTSVHRFAWDRGEPIDAKPGEKRPKWIDGH